MHEMALAEQIVDAALKAAGGAEREIAAVHVTMGAGGHLDRLILGEAFSMAATGTAAAGATLRIDRQHVMCPECGAPLDDAALPLCACGALQSPPRSAEVAVTAVEVRD